MRVGPLAGRPWRRWSAALVGCTAALVLASPGSASAHPLGNFTVNHYDGLRLTPDAVEDSNVLDTAEIPTFQERPSVDANHDGSVSAPELSVYSAHQCTATSRTLQLAVNGRPAAFVVQAAAMTYLPGAAGLATSRLTCRLRATVDLSRPATVTFADGFEGDRVGWHEITAVGSAVRLRHSPVPAVSVSKELRKYPNGLLSSPLNVRSAQLAVAPGNGNSTFGPTAGIPTANFALKALNALNIAFNKTADSRHLTVPVGLLAIVLSLLLGASHAALPGHGKTVMAAYIAGRRGSVRDAVTVGATVTITHTAGVLILGLLLTVSAALAGEALLRYLGVASGLLIAGIGGALLRSAIQRQRHRDPSVVHHSNHARPLEAGLSTPGGSSLDSGISVVTRRPSLAATGAIAVQQDDDWAEPHHHELGPAYRQHTHDGNHASHSHADDHASGAGGFTRGGLIGMGVAGGLVPSPSALVVLLGAIGLGRTVFGVILVLGYGIGMAATLTAAGLLLVKLRDRLGARAASRRMRPLLRLSSLLPILTATLVILVGLGLAYRGIGPSL